MRFLDDGYIDIEMNDSNYTVFFDYDFIRGYTAKNSGTSMAECEDLHDTYEFHHIQIEMNDGSLREATDDEAEYIEVALLERVE